MLKSICSKWLIGQEDKCHILLLFDQILWSFKLWFIVVVMWFKVGKLKIHFLHLLKLLQYDIQQIMHPNYISPCFHPKILVTPSVCIQIKHVFDKNMWKHEVFNENRLMQHSIKKMYNDNAYTCQIQIVMCNYMFVIYFNATMELHMTICIWHVYTLSLYISSIHILHKELHVHLCATRMVTILFMMHVHFWKPVI
jgi:hypothetical protein